MKKSKRSHQVEDQTEDLTPKQPAVAKKQYKVKLLKKQVRFSLLQATVFVAIFALIGSFILIKSFAAEPQSTGQPATYSPPPTFSVSDTLLGHSDNELLLRFKPGASAKSQQALLARYQAGVRQDIPQIGVKLISVPAEAQDAVKEALSHNPAIDFVEFNDKLKIADTTPNDPSWPSESSEVHVMANKAWDTTTGDPSAIIAILDTGVDPTTPDLQGKILPGYDVVNGDNDPSDDHGHGTMVAGVASAVSNNSLGIASYCWKCAILPVKVMASSGTGYQSDVATGIIWAADHGAKVINMSLYGSAYSTLGSAVQYAHSKGIILVAAAGNAGSSAATYPAAYPGVLGAAGTNPDDTLNTSSNYGSWVKLAAPMCNYGTSMKQPDGSYRYASFCGTSSASPAVAGIAGLLFSLSPTPPQSQIEQALTTKVDVCCGGNVGGGRVNAYKAVQSLAGITPPPADTTAPTVSVTSPTGGSTVSGSLSVSVSASDNVAVSKVDLLIDGRAYASSSTSPYSFFWDTTTAANGSHILTATAYDAAGNVSSSSVTVTVSNLADTVAPAVTITSPANGSVIGTRVTISGTATDNVAVKSMEVYVDGVLKGSSTSGSISISWNSRKAAKGSHTITVKAYDAAGNVGTSSVSVTK